MIIESKARLHEQTYSDSHRKLLGTHYTPEAVVDYIVTRALLPIMQNLELLPNCKILDPACGSGLFLLKAYDVLAAQWKRNYGHFSAKEARHILEDCLFGIDIDEKAVAVTRKFLAEKGTNAGIDSLDIKSHIVVGDALSLRQATSLFQFDDDLPIALGFQSAFPAHSFDGIIGNPPYIRIQNTPQAKRRFYAAAFATANGRFDIAGLFLELSEHLLKENGRLGFIVSNKVLSTSGTESLRRFLHLHFNLEEILDLSDTKLFAAAVLPLILIATRTKKKYDRLIFSSITEAHNKADKIYEKENLFDLLEQSEIPLDTQARFNNKLFYIKRFFASTPGEGSKVWTFHDERETSLLVKLKEQAHSNLTDLCVKISVGLKTTADNVFIKQMTQRFIKKQGLEEKLIFPLLESHNVERWSCNWKAEKDLYVLYPHIERDGKVMPVDLDDFPRVKSYLESFRQQLESRNYLKESQRRWYEIWVHQSPSDFNQRKIVTPDISIANRFAIDEKGLFVNGTCFYLILKDQSDRNYYSILGLLNSKLMDYFHKITSGNSLYAKRFRDWTSYLNSYPIPKEFFAPDSTTAAILIENVSKLLNHPTEKEIVEREKYNDRLCYKLFNLTESEILEIEKTLSVLGSECS